MAPILSYGHRTLPVAMMLSLPLVNDPTSEPSMNIPEQFHVVFFRMTVVFRGAVYFDRGATWFTLGTAVTGTRALNYSTFSNFQAPTSSSVGVGQAGSTMYGYEIGVDADHNYFTTAGSSVAKAFEQIEYSVCVVRAIYMRDALLRSYLGRVIIRSTLAHDPYTGLSQGDYLSAVRNEWNSNQTTDGSRCGGRCFPNQNWWWVSLGGSCGDFQWLFC